MGNFGGGSMRPIDGFELKDRDRRKRQKARRRIIALAIVSAITGFMIGVSL